MASCSTPRWVSTAPYVKLTVTLNTADSTETQAALDWKLEYISSSAANTSVAKSYTVKILGNTVKTGTYDIDGKTGTKTIASGQYTVAKITSARDVSIYVSFAFNLTWSGTYGGTKTASGSVSVPKKTSYAVKYNANGGSGAPSTQTKWHGTTLTLSSTKPTRSGYDFKGWGTTASDTSVNYAAGASYTANAAITLYAIWQATTYTVTYNANGGTGEPAKQTKNPGATITLSSTEPTRTGHKFQGWGTSASDTSKDYDPGASYSADKSITLYAIWKADTYTVSYNANGGTGAPGNQTKTYGKTLTLSTTKPTRTRAKFLGWGTSASTSTVSYAAGGSYTSNKAITLYAVWEIEYRKPRIYNVTVGRCNANGTTNSEGLSGLIEFDWNSDLDITSIVINWKPTTSTAWNLGAELTPGGTNGKVSEPIAKDQLSTETSYDIQIVVTDSGGSSNALDTISSMKFVIDIKVEGNGIGFGKAAELDDTADFGWAAKFNEPVYGKALGMDRVPQIPANSDLNNYMETGCYAVYTNADAATIANIPVAMAGRLEIWGSTGEGVSAEQYSYLTQRYIPYKATTNPVWERELYRNWENIWIYGEWFRSSLTEDLSNRLYDGQKVLWSGARLMHASQTADLSEPISKQMHGIVLVFSRYSSDTAQNYHFNTFFVSKKQVATHPGAGHSFIMTNSGDFALMACKYLYINDSSIAGNDVNNTSGTGTSGIKYTNNGYVLRYVIGV